MVTAKVPATTQKPKPWCRDPPTDTAGVGRTPVLVTGIPLFRCLVISADYFRANHRSLQANVFARSYLCHRLACMELRQLAYFVTVAEELSFTRAARRLQVVQSAVSTAIRALEKEVGAALFVRDSRHVRLSDAGSAMLPSARAALAAGRAAHDAVQAQHG